MSEDQNYRGRLHQVSVAADPLNQAAEARAKELERKRERISKVIQDLKESNLTRNKATPSPPTTKAQTFVYNITMGSVSRLAIPLDALRKGPNGHMRATNVASVDTLQRNVQVARMKLSMCGSRAASTRRRGGTEAVHQTNLRISPRLIRHGMQLAVAMILLNYMDLGSPPLSLRLK